MVEEGSLAINSRLIIKKRKIMVSKVNSLVHARRRRYVVAYKHDRAREFEIRFQKQVMYAHIKKEWKYKEIIDSEEKKN